MMPPYIRIPAVIALMYDTWTAVPSESTTGMYAVCDRDSGLDNCKSITLTGYIDSTTFASCDASGTEYTVAYVSECGTYTSGGANFSHQYVCESGCMVQKVWSNSNC